MTSDRAYVALMRFGNYRREKRQHARRVNAYWAAADHVITTLVIMWWVCVLATSTFHSPF